MQTSLIITTINKPNKNIKLFSKKSKKNKWDFIVIGDRKTPKNFKIKYGSYFNLNNQKKLSFQFAKKCPENNYARKNIGYLISIRNQANIIVETDDDNSPKNNFFTKKSLKHSVSEIKNRSWINIYDLFLKKKDFIWPRGLPLKQINRNKIVLRKKILRNFYLQQGVCERNPDVDAIYRLLNKSINIFFKKNLKVSLGNSLSTFNSQNTIWFKPVFPLLYLPVTCTMRCSDIWRSLIALAILRNDDKKILFFGTTMYQERNYHNLIDDFEQEIPMYLNNQNIFNVLSKVRFKKGIKNYLINLKSAYKALVKGNFVSRLELKYLDLWINDFNLINKN